MLQNIPIGQYVPGDSLIHRLDPRSKILFVLWFVMIVFLADRMISYSLLILFVLLVVKLSRLPFGYIMRGLKPLLWIILLTMFLHIFTTEGGAILWEWKGITIHEAGVIQAVFLSIRLTLLIVLASLLTLTTSPIDMTDGIEKLLSPFQKWGVPAHELAMMMSISIRFIPTLAEETDKIMKAQMARGADFDSKNLIRRIKSFVPLLVPLFISTFRRAEELALAMEARGYRGGEGRSKRRQLRFGRADMVSMVTALALAVVLLLMRDI
ncbi:MAG: energy-coupling factor transporter transmembrane protein EcfT [Bacillaceae bacterium]|nr:energy-coupling factor transporter transmembrane protein EcfT [Bacillaceae bacterium]